MCDQFYTHVQPVGGCCLLRATLQKKKVFHSLTSAGPVHFLRSCVFLCRGPRACVTGGVVCAASSKRPGLYVPMSERVYYGFMAGLKPKCVIRVGLWRIDYSAGLCCTSELSLSLFSLSPCISLFSRPLSLSLSLLLSRSRSLPPSPLLFSRSLIHSFSSHLFTR